MSLNTAAIRESTKISHSTHYQGFLISCIFSTFSTKKHVWVITASSRCFMMQPVWAATMTFFPLPPHHLLFPHLFLQPPHLPWSLLHPSPPPSSPSSPTTSSYGSALLHLQSAQVPRCSHLCIRAVWTLRCTTLQLFFPYCYNRISITWTRAVKTTHPLTSFQFSPFFPLSSAS